MSAPQPFEYWAFISYSHHDVRVARLLVEALAKAVVPKGRRGDVLGAATTFMPVFLDQHEATAAPRLDEALQQALRASAKLIVLCSPFAVQSRHVADEIRYFQQIGRAGDILCLVVSGEPGAAARGQPALECFPEPLAESAATAPLAANLGEESPEQWRHAVDQLTAGMLGQALQHRREWIAQRRKTRWMWLAGALGTIAAIAYGCAWAFLLTQYVYAKDGMRRWGGWEPVTPISAAMARQRPVSLRFSRRGAFGPWTEVRWLDGEGHCTDQGLKSIVEDTFAFQCTRSKACGVRLAYPNGKLANEVVFDQYEQTVETLTYPQTSAIVLNEAAIGCSRRPGDIESVALERQPDGPLAGMDRILRFTGGEDKSPHPNTSYAFGLRDERDTQGRLTLRTLLDPKGQPVVGREGYASRRWRYNEAGDVIEVATLGLDGEPVSSREGYALTAYEVDEAGRWTSRRYLDARGRAVRDKVGVHMVRAVWDEQGRQTALSYFDAQGRRVSDDAGVAAIRFGFSPDGASRTARYLDEKGRPTWNGELGCAVSRVTEPLDARWREERCFGLDDKPMVSKNGWHLRRQDYDEHGQEVSEAYHGIDGKPVMCGDADNGCPFHLSKNIFDKDGRRTGSRLHGLQGEPVLAGGGVAGFDLVYNGRNRIKRWINVGLDGQPTRDSKGVIANERIYDAFGRIVQELHVDAQGRPSQARTLVFGQRYEFDERGNISLVESFDQARRPVAAEQGAASISYRYDVFGRKLEERYFDAAKAPTVDDSGWFGAAYEYDDWGRLALATRLGPDGKPQADAEGILSRRILYNPRGHRVRLELLDANGKLAPGANGIAAWQEQRDMHGHLLSVRNLGRHGQLIADAQGEAGFDARFDVRGNQIRYTRIGADGQPVDALPDKIATIDYRFDERNRVVSKRFSNAKREPAPNGEGVYGYAYRYDPLDREIETRYLGIDDHLMASREGLARTETDYDATGGVAEIRHFAIDAKPGAYAWAPVARHRNDVYGRTVEIAFFDADGKPILGPASGRAKVTMQRDVFGRVLTERSLDAEGKLVNRRDKGWAYRTYAYDGMGNLAQTRCFDRSGRDVTPCEKDQ